MLSSVMQSLPGWADIVKDLRRQTYIVVIRRIDGHNPVRLDETTTQVIVQHLPSQKFEESEST